MKKCLVLLVLASLACGGCALPQARAGTSAHITTPAAATDLRTLSPTLQATAQVLSPSPSTGPERTPDPAAEMIVAGFVTAVLDDAVQVRDDALGKDLVVTMLSRAEYAEGVPREFKEGNYVRIIASNRLAKTLPERTAARCVLENK